MKRVKEIDYIVAWMLFVVCSSGFILVASFLTGAVLGALMGALGVPMNILQAICGVAGYLVGIPISYIFFRIFVAVFIVRRFNND